jgi:hypothetical protein
LARKSLPGLLQKGLERYSNFFGIIIWRVFTVDVINFFVNIHIVELRTGARQLYSRSGRMDWKSRFRYLHVGEFVCLASLFTTLKYYPSNRSLFEERLMRYAKTIPCPAGSRIVFEYVSIKKAPRCFEYVPVVEYVVDLDSLRIAENMFDPNYSFRVETSPVHEARSPGTYAPANASEITSGVK